MSRKELREVAKEYKKGCKVKFQRFWGIGKSVCLNNSESIIVKQSFWEEKEVSIRTNLCFP